MKRCREESLVVKSLFNHDFGNNFVNTEEHVDTSAQDILCNHVGSNFSDVTGKIRAVQTGHSDDLI